MRRKKLEQRFQSRKQVCLCSEGHLPTRLKLKTRIASWINRRPRNRVSRDRDILHRREGKLHRGLGQFKLKVMWKVVKRMMRLIRMKMTLKMKKRKARSKQSWLFTRKRSAQSEKLRDWEKRKWEYQTDHFQNSHQRKSMWPEEVKGINPLSLQSL